MLLSSDEPYFTGLVVQLEPKIVRNFPSAAKSRAKEGSAADSRLKFMLSAKLLFAKTTM